MELLYTEQKTIDKYKTVIVKLVISILMALGFTGFFLSLVSIPMKVSFTYSFKEGFYYFWNQMSETLGNSDYYLITPFQNAGKNLGWFLIGVILVGIVINYLILLSSKIVSLLIYVTPPIAVTLIFQVVPSLVWVGVFILGLYFALLCILHREKLSIKSLVIIGLLIFTVFLGADLLNLEGKYIRPTVVNQLGTKIEEIIYDARYGNNILENGKLGRLSSREKDGSIALEVTMDKPKPMYLKGFVGSRYSSNEWKPLALPVYNESRSLFYWLNKDEFSPLYQIGSVGKLTDIIDDKKKNLAVKVVDGNTQFKYLPYELGDMPQGKSWADSFFTTDGFFGERTYDYNITPVLTDKWTDLAAKVFSVKENEDITDYRRLESNYNVFAYENYLAIPDNVLEILSKELGYRGNQKKAHIGYKLAIEKVRDYFKDNTIYTEKLSEKEESTDFLVEFFTKKKGYDAHFATAATMMFRYYGIPARYVEGYIITPEKAKAAEKNQGLVKVSRDENHGWTEIYIDSLGWVPIEVTNEYIDLMPQPDMSVGIESETYVNPFKDKPNNGYADVTDTENEDKDREAKLPWNIIWLVLGIIALILAIWKLLLPILKKLKEKSRLKKKLNHQDNRIAVCSILEFLKDKERTGKFALADLALEIGYKAAYSESIISDDDRKLMMEEMVRWKNEKKK